MKWLLIIAWGIAQVVALFSGNFLLFLVMVLIDAVWFVGANLSRIANQPAQQAPVLSSTQTTSVAGGAQSATPATVSGSAASLPDWDDLAAEMEGVLEFTPPQESDNYGWSNSTVDLARMEYRSSGGADEFSSETETLLRRAERGWEFKELWTVKQHAGRPEASGTPIDDLNEEYGVGTPKWDPELEAQYRRKVAKALSWRPIPEPLSGLLEKHYQAALIFFQKHAGLYPRMPEPDFKALKPGAAVWNPPVHPENAAPERFVLVCIDGPDKGDGFPLRARGLLLIGRSSECQWQLHDPGALDRQFQLKVDDNSVLLRDLGGGTAINGAKPGEQVLVAGDVIKFGATSLKIVERKSTPPEPPPPKQPKKRTSFDEWAEKFPEARLAQRESVKRYNDEAAILRAAHNERIRQFREQKDRSIAAARAAHDDMIRPLKDELDRAVKPLRSAYGKADSDLADEAASPFVEKFYRASEPARKMLKDAEKAADETYKAQTKSFEETLAREMEPLTTRYQEEQTEIMNSTKPRQS